MKLSVVTVCRNSVDTIGYALESFFQQDHADAELVVIDGASDDGTLDLINRFACDRLTVISERDGGIYDAMNKGLSTFTGDAVGFLNADDRFHHPGALSALAATLEGADIAYGDLDVVNTHVAPEVLRRWRSSPWTKGAFRQGWMPAHPTFYCRRRVIDAVGAFDLRYQIAADYDFMLRALELGDFTAAQAPGVLVDMQAGGRSSTGIRQRVFHNLEALQSRRRWLGAGVVDYALIAKPLRKVTQFVRV